MDTLQEVLTYGSVPEALQSQCVTSTTLLEYLSSCPVTDTTLIMYKHVCSYIGSEQYLFRDGVRQHFLSLVKDPRYGAIFILMQCDVKVKVIPDQDIPNNPTVGLLLIPSYALLTADKSSKYTIRAICNKSVKVKNENTEILSLLIQSRNEKTLNKLPLNGDLLIQHCRYCIDTDWFDRIKQYVKVSSVFVHIMERCKTLSTRAPQYWSFVRGQYQELVRLASTTGSLSGTKIEDIIEMDRIVPGIIDPRLVHLNDLSYKIYLLQPEVAAYVLGYPIQFGIPTYNMFLDSLKHLTNVGKEQYCKDLRRHNRKVSQFVPKPFLREGEKISMEPVNKKDTREEDIFDYGPFDYLASTGTHLFYFTRPEFDTCTQSHLNHWTSSPMAYATIYEMLMRQRLAKTLGLPAPNTILGLLGQVESDTLFSEPPHEQDISETSNEANPRQHEVGSVVNIRDSASLYQFMSLLSPLLNIDYSDS